MLDQWRRRLLLNDRESYEAPSKRVLNSLGIGSRRSVLFGEATARPYGSRIAGVRFVELCKELITELR